MDWIMDWTMDWTMDWIMNWTMDWSMDWSMDSILDWTVQVHYWILCELIDLEVPCGGIGRKASNRQGGSYADTYKLA